MSGAGLKKCMPTTRSGRRDGGGDLRHRQRRRVRREDRVRADDPLELGEELELRVELLDDRLDHEVAVREVGELGRQRRATPSADSRSSAVIVLLVDLALEEVRDPLARLRAELVRDLAADGLVAGLDGQLRDPGAHGAETDDADSTDLRERS